LFLFRVQALSRAASVQLRIVTTIRTSIIHASLRRVNRAGGGLR
jgi:hypothetical protein